MELESPAEHAHETIREHLSEGGHRHPSRDWHSYVALSTLFMALLSAFAALMAALAAHESLLERTREILDFVELETDRLEIELLRAKHDILEQFDETPPASELDRLEAFRERADVLAERAAEEEDISQTATHAHLVLALAVTLLSIGITLSGIAVITNRRFPWYVGLVFGVAGAIGAVLGFMDMPGL